jgi:hypothetical protein
MVSFAFEDKLFVKLSKPAPVSTHPDCKYSDCADYYQGMTDP